MNRLTIIRGRRLGAMGIRPKVMKITKNVTIKTHDSELRGQEEAGRTRGK